MSKQILSNNPQAPIDCGKSQSHPQHIDKLEIGSGHLPKQGYVHLDIDPDSPHVDLVGDIRSIFSSDYNLSDFPDIVYLKDSFEIFSEIRAIHVIEHVQWLYQKPLFEWFYRLLTDGGQLVIETPDLAWIAKSYIKNKRRKRFPVDDHPNLSESDDFVAWVNFKLYSGCSKGDYHHCCYDMDWLKHVMLSCGFSAAVRRKGGVLYAVGSKHISNRGDQKLDDYFTV